MKRFTFIVPAIIICLMSLPIPAFAARPTVAKAEPDNGDKNVDPATRQIKIVFDQDMSRRGHSVCGGGETFPKLVGKPRWANQRTFILTVALEPNHDYRFSINCPSAQNFKNAKGESAVPYPIRFSTGPAKDGAAELSTADLNAAAVKTLREMIDLHYAYRDRVVKDWDAQFKDYDTLLMDAKTPKRFAQVAAAMLGAAEDKHIHLLVDGESIPSFRRPMTPNMNPDLLPTLVPHYRQASGIVYTGMFDDGIGYARIDSWSTQDPRAYEAVYRMIGEHPDMPGLVIDVRLNGGGSETLAGDLAGCFVDKRVVYAKHVNRNPSAEGGFTPVHERVLEPNPGRPAYHGKVAVLSGPVVMSSCEAFVLMMKQAPNATVFGATTQGCSGNPRPYNLGNGVTVSLPSWKTMLPDGTEFEGIGVAPDIPVAASPIDFTNHDPVLDAALKHLRQ